MKTIQVRFNVGLSEDAEYSCLYIRNDLRGRSAISSVESCSCPEIRVDKDSFHIFLRGEDREKDNLVCYFPRLNFNNMIAEILSNLLRYDKRYSNEDDEEKSSEIIINGNIIRFNSEEQEKLIELLRIKI